MAGRGKIHNALSALVLVLLFAKPHIAFCQSWGPWSISEDAPVIFTTVDRDGPAGKNEIEPHNIAATPFLWLIKIYQRFITTSDGDRCPMYPTCSQYSLQAIHKHGPFIGIVMTADRLIHETDEQGFLQLVRIGNRYRYPDPVENNDFWWYRE